MHLQSLETACQVGLIHNDPAVKPSCTEQRLVQNFRTVGGGEDHNALGGIEAVDLGEQLVQGLLPFVVAAQTAVTALTDGVDLINEDNGGSLLGGLLEQVAHTACADAHEHLDKIRTGDEEERDTCFTGYCLSQQGFTGTGGANQQRTLGDFCTDGGVFLGLVEEVDDLLKGFLGFVLTGDICKGHAGFLFHINLGLALADAHAAAHLAAYIPHQERKKEIDQHKGQYIGEQNLDDG